MRGRRPEITEGIGGGVEGLPAGKQAVVEQTELPGAQWAQQQARDYNFKADSMLYANFYFIEQALTITKPVTSGQLIPLWWGFASTGLEVFYKCQYVNINKYLKWGYWFCWGAFVEFTGFLAGWLVLVFWWEGLGCLFICVFK